MTSGSPIDLIRLEGEGNSVELDPDGERADVTIADRSMSMATVMTVTVVVTDASIVDACHRLDQVVQAWPLEGP